jgi:hypothetical protein
MAYTDHAIVSGSSLALCGSRTQTANSRIDGIICETMCEMRHSHSIWTTKQVCPVPKLRGQRRTAIAPRCTYNESGRHNEAMTSRNS